ncbi:MAG: lytic transglycosylase domain-containing protein [Bacteriovoracaceae bacterium]
MDCFVKILSAIFFCISISVVFNYDAEAMEYPSKLSSGQRELLTIAYEEGKAIGFPETIQSILWQETRAKKNVYGSYGVIGDDKGKDGLTKPLGKKSYGAMQVRLDSAKEVLRRYPNLGKFKSDEELLVALLTNDRFNIRVGTYYFKMQLEDSRIKKSWDKAVLSYNVGAGNVSKHGLSFDPNRYLLGICNHIKYFLKPLNKELISVK